MSQRQAATQDAYDEDDAQPGVDDDGRAARNGETKEAQPNRDEDGTPWTSWKTHQSEGDIAGKQQSTEREH